MITQAAIKDKWGKIWTLPRPNRHSDIFKLLKEFAEEHLKEAIMGFIDEDGKFYNRREAWDHVIDGGQSIYIYNPTNPNDRRIDKNPNVCGSLFSEDLW